MGISSPILILFLLPFNHIPVAVVHHCDHCRWSAPQPLPPLPLERRLVTVAVAGPQKEPLWPLLSFPSLAFSRRALLLLLPSPSTPIASPCGCCCCPHFSAEPLGPSAMPQSSSSLDSVDVALPFHHLPPDCASSRGSCFSPSSCATSTDCAAAGPRTPSVHRHHRSVHLD